MTEHYHLTDFDPTAWANAYCATTVLLGSSLPVAVVFRVYDFKTHKDRDALFVGLTLLGRRVRRSGLARHTLSP